MRNVREPRDHRDARERVDVPGHVAEEVLGPQRIEADRPHRHDVAERQHHRRHEHGDQHQHFDDALARQVGAGKQERERGAERQRDQRHAGGDDDRIDDGVPEIRVVEDEAVRTETQMPRGIEERRRQKALPEDQQHRRQDHQRGDRDDGGARNAEASGGHRPPAVMSATAPRRQHRPASHLRPSAACHCLRNSSRLVWSRPCSRSLFTAIGFTALPSSLANATPESLPVMSVRTE